MRRLVPAIFLSVAISAGFAQSSRVPAPAPALNGAADPGEPTTPKYQDNARPLGGVLDFNLGDRAELFNLLNTSIDVGQSYGTNPGLRTGPLGQTIWGSTSNLGGSIQLMRSNTAQQFSLDYRGAAQIYSQDSSLNTQMHTFGVSDSINTGRWNFVVANDFSYEPNAYGANAPMLFPGSTPNGGTGLRPGLGPESTILTDQNTRISNTSVGQVSYGLSRSSTVSGSVSYGVLHYSDNAFLDTDQLTGTGNYSHRFGKNSIGFGYTFSRFMYSNAAENFETHASEFSYGRRVLGRMSFELAVGPTFTSIHLGPISSVDTSVNGRASLRYAGNRTNVNLSYVRAVTSGSGITPGALTDNVTGSLQHKLTHSLTADIAGGYSRNSGTVAASTYNGVYASAGITRDVGRYMSLSLGYSGLRQTSDATFANLSSHSVVVSLHWRFRPIRLDR